MGRQVTEKEEDFDRDTIRELIDRAETNLEKAFVAVVFLTGGRVSECLTLKKQHFILGTKNTRKFLIIKIRTLKKRKYKRRILPIPLDDPLIHYITNYLDEIEEGGLLFPFSRTKAWRIIKRLSKRVGLDLWLHLLRHMRLTELVVERDFTDQHLVGFAGWSDSRPAKEYIKLNWKNIADKM
jgi:integrase